MLVSSAHSFFKFAYSESPIERMEVIGLFAYALNFFVYLIVITVILAWITRGKQSPKKST